MTRDEQKAEAIACMNALKLHKNVIRDFQQENIINMSEDFGIIYWLADRQKAYVKEFENKYKALVYHVIHNKTEYGDLLSFLYISWYADEWESARVDLIEGNPLAYVKNLDDESCSEFGRIGVKSLFGGLIRIY